MVKKLIFMVLITTSFVTASEFEENCLDCHTNDFKFNMMMKKYTTKYSSEKRIKKAIFEYLKNPTEDKSVLPIGYINRFGIKEKTELNDKTLKDMIDRYYKQFNLKSKIY